MTDKKEMTPEQIRKRKEYAARYYQANKERHRANYEAWLNRDGNRERVKEQQKKWWANNTAKKDSYLLTAKQKRHAERPDIIPRHRRTKKQLAQAKIDDAIMREQRMRQKEINRLKKEADKKELQEMRWQEYLERKNKQKKEWWKEVEAKREARAQTKEKKVARVEKKDAPDEKPPKKIHYRKVSAYEGALKQDSMSWWNPS